MIRMSKQSRERVIFIALIAILAAALAFSWVRVESPVVSTRIYNALEIIITDFSAWQGTINFAIMKQQAGATYGRCCVGAPSDGGYKDPRWDQNVGGMELVEMVWSPYAVYYPPNAVSESTQFWLSILGDEAYQHPLVIDAELDGGENTFRVTNRLWDTIVEWERITGIKPWIYSGQWWWDSWIEPGFGKDGLVWDDIVGGYIVADYYSITSPLIPRDWSPEMVYLWQFSSKCSGPLFGAESTYIDCNRLWSGISLEELAGMWGYTVTPLPTPTETVTPEPTFTETVTPQPSATETPKPTEKPLPSVTASPVIVWRYYLPYVQVEP